MDFQSPVYKNLISHIDINRNVDSIGYFDFADLTADLRFYEFEKDTNSGNDTIELSLIKNKAYKEAIILTLSNKVNWDAKLLEMLKEEQKTFGGSKLFYLNDKFDKILPNFITVGEQEGKSVKLFKFDQNVTRGSSFSRIGKSAIMKESFFLYDKICIKFDKIPSRWKLDDNELCNKIQESAGEATTLASLKAETAGGGRSDEINDI